MLLGAGRCGYFEVSSGQFRSVKVVGTLGTLPNGSDFRPPRGAWVYERLYCGPVDVRITLNGAETGVPSCVASSGGDGRKFNKWLGTK